MRTRYTRKILSSALGLIVLGCLWFWFAPVGLGGSTSYVVTHGVSMEPRIHTGDLAIVRSQSSYHVGEIVAYENKMLHTIVLHRIIARAGARYVFKGDNNNFVDFEHPAANQLIGALWIHIPGVGTTLMSIGSPALIGVLVAIGLLLLTGSVFARRRRLRRRERRAGAGAQPPSPRLPLDTATPAAGILAIGLLLLVPLLVLMLIAFTRSPTAPRRYTVPYTQSGTLSYSAAVTPGPAYPGGRVVTGDPLFTHVVKAVAFSFGYRLDAAGRHSLTGKASLDASVVSTDGWKTTIELAPPTRFHGSRARVAGTLELTSLLALIHSVQTATKASGSYTLTLLPHVSTTGSVDALPLHATFAPTVVFSLTELEAQPVVSSGSSPAAGSPAGAQSAASPFAPSASATATGNRSQPVFLSLAIARLPVATARTIALGAIAILICAMLAILALLRPILALVRPPRADESAGILARYGRQIVPVARVRQLPGVSVIDVADIEALVRIAEHYERSILHETLDDGEAFWVTDESGQFRYLVGAYASTALGEVLEQSPPDPMMNGVHTEELHFGGVVTAYETQPAEDAIVEPPAAYQPQPAAEPVLPEPVAEHEWAPATYILGGSGAPTRSL
jgi:signal peptidase I